MRSFLGNLPRVLDWRGLELAMEESCGPEGREQMNKALNAQLYNIDLDLQRETKRMITNLTDKVLRSIFPDVSISLQNINKDSPHPVNSGGSWV